MDATARSCVASLLQYESYRGSQLLDNAYPWKDDLCFGLAAGFAAGDWPADVAPVLLDSLWKLTEAGRASTLEQGCYRLR